MSNPDRKVLSISGRSIPAKLSVMDAIVASTIPRARFDARPKCWGVVAEMQAYSHATAANKKACPCLS